MRSRTTVEGTGEARQMDSGSGARRTGERSGSTYTYVPEVHPITCEEYHKREDDVEGDYNHSKLWPQLRLFHF